MREITLYVAYDDKEFDNYEACLAYENKAYGLMVGIAKKYSFYDKNMNETLPPSNSSNVEDWLTWLDNAYSYCTYIRKTGSLTDDEVKITKNIGACIYDEDFNCEVGLFRYDTHTMEWVKVDE